MMKERTIEQVQKDLDIRCGKRLYEVLNKNKDYVTVRHLRCNGIPFEIELTNLYSRIKTGRIDICRFCERKLKKGYRKSISELQESLEEVGNNGEYEIISGTTRELEVLHTECNNKFKSSMKHLVERVKRRYHRCPQCNNKLKSLGDVIDFFKINGYITNIEDVKNNYKNELSKIPCREIIAPNVLLQISVNQIKKRKHKGNKYYRSDLIDTKKANHLIVKKYGTGMVIITKAQGNNNEVEGYCYRCGCTINDKFKNIIRRKDPCKICSVIKGFELQFDNVLKKINVFLRANSRTEIFYKRDNPVFPDCRDKKVLLFDFVFFKNNKLIIVECDLDPNHRYNKNTIRKDKIKDDYCMKNNIPLIRINNINTWYKDFLMTLVKYEILDKMCLEYFLEKN